MRLWNPRARRVKVSRSSRRRVLDLAATKPVLARIGFALAGSLLLNSSPALAEPGSGAKGQAWQQLKLDNPGAEHGELRQLFKVQWNGANRNAVQSIAQPIFDNNSITQTQTSNQTGNLANFARNEARAAEQALKFQQAAEERAQKFELKETRNLQKQEMRDSTRNFNNTVQQISADKYVNVNGGLSLDLGSAVETITLGDKLFQQGSSITITVGGESKTLAAGSKVTAAEYIAAKQVIATGGQKLGLDGDGRAISGAVDLSELTPGDKTMKVSDFVVPVNVSASGDFGKQGDVRISGDLINNGSIQAFSSDKNFASATIRADNITNNADASISSVLSQNTRDLGGVVSDLGLNLHAEDSLKNFGSIESAGDLTLSAGKVLSNSGQAIARNDLNLQAPSITNSGRIESLVSNINIDSSSTSALNVNNAGGTLAALDGAINIRNADYAAPFNTLVSGGDLLSKEVNVYTGGGTADVFVNDLIGIINTSGSAAHVSANTSVLTIGKQCLIGDPTYFNTGDIVLDGDIVVGEKLAIISGGNITATSNVSQITARDASGQGYAINVIAGANITTPASGQISPNGGPAVLDAQNASYTDNATSTVTIDTTAPVGGNIDFSSAATNFSINSNSTIGDLAGGSITLAAFANGAVGGRVILPITSTIKSGGCGSGENGNISIFGPNSILAGFVDSSGGTGGYGDIKIFASQAKAEIGPTLTFDASGAVLANNSLVSTGLVPTGAIFVGTVTSSGSAEIRALNDIRVGDLFANGKVVVFNDASGANGNIVAGSITSVTDNVFVRGLGAITTENISSYGNVLVNNQNSSTNASVSLGNIDITHGGIDIDSKGNVTVGDVLTRLGIQISANWGAGGSLTAGHVASSLAEITLYSFNDISVTQISSADAINVISMFGKITVGNVSSANERVSMGGKSDFNVGNVYGYKDVSLSSETGLFRVGDVTSATGKITIGAARSIVTDDLSAMGNVTINQSGAFTISTHDVSSLGGEIRINASNIASISLHDASAFFHIIVRDVGSISTNNLSSSTGLISLSTVAFNGSIAVGDVVSRYVSIKSNKNVTAGDFSRSIVPISGVTNSSLVIIAGSSGAVSVGAINVDAPALEDGGYVDITAGTGGLIVGPISANGGTPSHGGIVRLTANQNSVFISPTITAIDYSASPSGGVNIYNLGQGGLRTGGQITSRSLTLVTDTGAITLDHGVSVGEHVFIDSGSTIQQTSGIIKSGSLSVSFKTGNTTLLTDVALLDINSPGGQLTIHEKDSIAIGYFSNLVIGSLILDAGSAADSASISIGNISNGQSLQLHARGSEAFLSIPTFITVTGSVSLTSDGRMVNGSSINADSLYLSYASGALTLSTSINSLSTNAPTGSLLINNVRALRLDNQNIGELNVRAFDGDITTNGSINVSGALQIESSSGSILLNNDLRASSITLKAAQGLQQSSGNLITGDVLNLQFVTGNTVLHTAVNTINLKGQLPSLTIHESDGVSIDGQNTSNLNLSYVAALVLSAGEDSAGEIEASNLDGGAITFTNSSSIHINNIDAQTISVTTASNVYLDGFVHGESAIALSAGGTILQDELSTLETGLTGILTLDYSTGPVNLNANIWGLVTDAPGQSLTINDVNGLLLFHQDLDTLKIRVTGAVGNVYLQENMVISSLLDILIPDGTVYQESGVLTTADFRAQASRGIFGRNGIRITNGSNAISISAFNSPFGVVQIDSIGTGIVHLKGGGGGHFEVTSAGGIETQSDISASTSVNLYTNSLKNEHSITSKFVSIQSINGNLLIDGGVGGNISGTASTPGAPGSPGQSVVVLSANGGTLTLAGKQTVNGDALLSATSDQLVIANDSNWVGTNNVSVSLSNIVMNGSLTANDLILAFEGAGTIINTNGDVNLNSNIVLNGKDLTILASGNVNAGNIQISLSTGSGDAGDLTIVAGYSATPLSGGQIRTDTLFTVGRASKGGSINLAEASIFANSYDLLGKGGDIVLVASKGTVAVGSIESNPFSDFAGSINVIGEKGVRLGSVRSGGTEQVRVSVARPTIVGGPISINNGTASGGFFAPGKTSAGSILIGEAVGYLVELRGGLSTGNTIKASNITANNLAIYSGVGETTLHSNSIALLESYASGTVNMTNLGAANMGIVAAGRTQKLNVTSVGAIRLGDINVDRLVGISDAAISCNSRVTANSVSLTSGAFIGPLNIAAPILSLTHAADFEANYFEGYSVNASSLSLRSTNGSIGTSSERFVLSSSVSAVTAYADVGSVFLASNSNSKRGININGGYAGGSSAAFDYEGAGLTNVNGSITTADGDINIVIARDRINVGSTANLQANGLTGGNGDILLRVSDLSALAVKTSQINFLNGSQLHTDATTGAGNITISVGAVNAPVAGTSPSSGAIFSLQGGSIYWGAMPSKYGSSTSNFIAKGANIVLNNNLGSKNISFNGATIDADPPVEAGTPLATNAGLFDYLSSPSPTAVGGVALSSYIPLSHSNLALNSKPGVMSDTSLVSPSILTPFSNLVNASTLFIQSEHSDQDNSYAVGYCNTSNEIDGAICSDTIVPGDQIFGTSRVQAIEHADKLSVETGAILFVPTRDSVVETPLGTVRIGGHSVALVSITEAGLAVFDLDDQHKSSVSVESHGHNVVLSPGRHVLITPHHQHEFAQLNAIETISHRGLTSTVKNGHRAHISEFSVISALDSVKPLKAIVASRHPQARKVASRMMKTTAIIMQLGGAGGQYQHYFKPRMTAMGK